MTDRSPPAHACARVLLEAAPEPGPGTQMPPPAVEVVPVFARELAPWDDFNGRVESPHDVRVFARVPGYVKSIPSQEGVEVKQGDLLFVIDPRPYQAELAQAEANVGRARAKLDLAKRDVKRAAILLRRDAITQEDYDTRQSDSAQAKAELHAAEAARELAQLNLSYTEVRAPLDGRISRAVVSLGDFVTGAPTPTLLTTLVSLDPIYVYFDCDEETYLRHVGKNPPGALGSTQEGLRVLVARAGDDGFPFTGVVDFVDNRVEQTTGTVRMRARLDNADRALSPGLYASVRLLGRSKVRTLIVDGKAVLTDQDRKYVYVVKDGRAQRRNVKLGRALERYRIVSEGLTEGEPVIVSGLAKVRPDVPVSARPARPSALGDPER